MKNHLLSNLLLDYLSISSELDREITGITLDSREIKPGYLFCAYPGHNDDGRKYINAAIEKGATAILSEGSDKPIIQNSVPILYVENLAQKVSEIAARFYDHPSRRMTVIGVTGTNGKTSITQLIAKALDAVDKPCGVMGTLGIGFIDKLIPTGTTTPDAVTIQKKIAEFLDAGAKAVAMEASSHRLEQRQLDAIDFKIAVFTNLTRDHLDYHGDMEHYGAAKKRLFLFPNLEYAIINADDEFGRKLLNELPSTVKPIAYSTSEQEINYPTVYAKNIKLSINGFSAEINSPWGNGIIQSKLLGQFNVSNLLAVLATLCAMGIEFATALNVVSKLSSVIGRMQILGGGKLPTVVVDYAHTPDALEKVLVSLREHSHGEIWCVFGCGGERDRGKRALMGQIAERYSDQLIITDDNPRGEDPKTIVADIVSGLLCPWAAKIEHDREVAIFHAIDCANPNDVILIAGKGHENYQIIGKEKLNFNDAEKVKGALARRKK